LVLVKAFFQIHHKKYSRYCIEYHLLTCQEKSACLHKIVMLPIEYKPSTALVAVASALKTSCDTTCVGGAPKSTNDSHELNKVEIAMADTKIHF
jgi:hypothetical protein